eukprot:320552-Chlamydomonas_euryale.AAC.34
MRAARPGRMTRCRHGRGNCLPAITRVALATAWRLESSLKETAVRRVVTLPLQRAEYSPGRPVPAV